MIEDRTRDQEHHPDVVAGLGWPGTNTTAASRLGWPGSAAEASAAAHRTGSPMDPPAEPPASDPGLGHPQDPQHRPQDSSDNASVSRETPAEDIVVQPGPADTAAGAADDSAAEVAAPASAEAREPRRVSPEPSAAERFGPHPGPGTPFRTAAELAAAVVPPDDDTTPLARSVEHELLARRSASREPMARPPRTRVMVVANQKGGVGKTTTTVNLAAALAQHGLRVLVVDLDPQGNASTALAIAHHRGTPSTYDAVVDGTPLADVVQESPEIPGLFVVPATIDLAGAEIELVSLVARESRLRKAVHGHPQVLSDGDDRFDYVLIDCPPSLGLLTLNALVAGDEMLIPIQAEYYALEGLGQLLETVEMVKAHLNPDLAVSTILLTMYDARTRLSAGVAEEVRTHFGGQVLSTAIPRSVRISEAPSYGQTVITYDPGSPGALSYLEAARELATRGATEGERA